MLSFSLHNRFIDLDVPVYHAIHVKELSPSPAILPSNAVNTGHLIDSVAAALDDKSGLAIDKNLWNASFVCGNNRRTAGERLHERKAERFRKRNQVQATISLLEKLVPSFLRSPCRDIVSALHQSQA